MTTVRKKTIFALFVLILLAYYANLLYFWYSIHTNGHSDTVDFAHFKDSLGASDTDRQNDSRTQQCFTVNRLSLADILSLEQHPISSHLLMVPKNYSKRRFYVDRKSRLAFCVILKNMSTVLLALFCKREGTMSSNLTPALNGPNVHSGCAASIPRISSYSAQWDTDWKLWTLVRDPFDRWLSACADQCMTFREGTMCYGCTSDPICFLTRYRQVLLAAISIKPDPYEASNCDHFFPQLWSCSLQDHYHQFDMIIRYNKTEEFKTWFRSQFAAVGYGTELLESGWTKCQILTVNDVGRPIIQPNTNCSNNKFMDKLSDNTADKVYEQRPRFMNRSSHKKDKIKYKMANSIELMELYLSIYLVDHVYLRYPVPTATSELCKKCLEGGPPDCQTMLICLVSDDWSQSIYLSQ